MSEESKREASGEEKVIFDVGGKMYTVSRSLIEEHSDTMLARIVSKTWLEDPNSTVFIDRDGDTFRFVLDYLRYGSVDLPHNMPMANFKRDMDFYGIVAEDAASVKQVSPADELRRLKQTVAKGELNHDMFLIAIHANHSFVTGKSSLAIANSDKELGLKHSPSDYSNSSTKASELLSGYLKTYFGLKGYDITFSKTSGMSVKVSKPDWGDEGWGDIFQPKLKPNPFADVAREAFGSSSAVRAPPFGSTTLAHQQELLQARERQLFNQANQEED